MRSDVIVEVLVVGESSVGAGDGELAAAVDLHGQQGVWVPAQRIEEHELTHTIFMDAGTAAG